jgi:antitoxin (DNA-binding transcriptional repressor) of toxin-antitoxin stability system
MASSRRGEAVSTISHKELLSNLREILRRTEAGERFTLTVAGRSVANLGPASRRQWINTNELADLWRLPVDPSLARDLDAFGGELRSF